MDANLGRMVFVAAVGLAMVGAKAFISGYWSERGRERARERAKQKRLRGPDN